MERKKVTFADIAKYTNFSKTTISRYFNNPDSLTLENQEKIAKALEELGYQKNKLAKVLANGKSEFVGIIIPNLYFHYYSEMLNKILASYEEYNYKFLVFIGNHKKEVERKYIQELLAYKIEGLIVLSNTISSEELKSYNIPVVTIEREAKYVCSVDTDNYTGAAEATDLLIKNNCDVLIHINNIFPEYVPSYDRIRAFIDVCDNNNAKYELIRENFGYNYESVFAKMQNIFNEIDEKYLGQKKGIFLSNDTYANIFLNLVIQKYGNLPEHYRIVGFDNSPIASEAVVPITTIAQQIDKIANTAMDLLVLQMTEMKKRKPIPLKEPTSQTDYSYSYKKKYNRLIKYHNQLVNFLYIWLWCFFV